MNKFTKISAATLFALFLAACDKPAEKAAIPEPAKQEATQPAEAPKAAEEARSEVAKTEVAAADTMQGAEDFKKLLEWKQTQEQNFTAVQAELEQQIASQDKAKIEQSLEMFKGKIADILSGLDALEVKSPEVNVFKAKAKENLELLNGLVVESVKAMTTPTPELQNSIQEKLQSLQQSTSELNQIQMELEKKFLNKE